MSIFNMEVVLDMWVFNMGYGCGSMMVLICGINMREGCGEGGGVPPPIPTKIRCAI